MSVSTITAGQKDWLTTLNNDLSELANRDSGTWVSSGLTAINGYTNTNCAYFLGKIGGQSVLMIQGTVTKSNGSITGQTANEVLQLPASIAGYGRLVVGYGYAENSNNGYPLWLNYSPNSKRLILSNVSGQTITFTSVRFGIILTN
ncbi:hypothetical protein PO252_05080 [Limosilactobacillus mucosae]|uniref:hypothetical protein n=1 Tax=Limosilactobacillus mucosae TaxID=97478 RepID=UPI00233ED027|nr:hypothetical protein [Limosilactobacillus mucosae]MDC2839209.1 hypothetical protein [Limosilactobacillus mucosae]